MLPSMEDRRQTDRIGLYILRPLPFIARCFQRYPGAALSRRTPRRASSQLTSCESAANILSVMYSLVLGFDNNKCPKKFGVGMHLSSAWSGRHMLAQPGIVG